MPRWVALCVFVVLMLVGGILAGQGVHSSLARAEPQSAGARQTDDRSEDFAQAEFHEPHPVAECRVPFAVALSTNRSDTYAATLVSKTTDAFTLSEVRVDAPPRHNGVLQLILKAFPNADPETAKIWEEAFSEMDLSDVEFILEQKRLLSESLESLPTTTTEMRLLPDGTEFDSADAEPLNRAIHRVSLNLSGSWTVGFRGTVLLPEAVCHRSRDEDRKNEQKFRSLMFYSFDPGKRISSPLPLHVALPADDGALMFCLEGNLLTRRGDFQLLADRRVGLTTHGGPVPLLHSSILPESAMDVSISDGGEIQYVDTAGMTVIAGRVAVARVVDLSELSSDDGVFFVTRSSESLLTPEPDKIRLSTGILELSNVDRENEQALLSHLQSLRPSVFYDPGFR